MKKYTTEVNPNRKLEGIVYFLPWDSFFIKQQGRWNIEVPLSKTAIQLFLRDYGYSSDEIKTLVDAACPVLGFEMAPGAPAEFFYNDAWYINLWRAPKLSPKASTGGWPRIQKILEWLTDGSKEDLDWLLHWSAAKIQEPSLLPKVAIVLQGHPGSAKSTYARVMREILGVENCAVVGQGSLESQFNSSWIEKLLVVGEEMIAGDTTKRTAEKLKMLITSEELEQEAKGKNRRRVANHLAWIFTSNNEVNPLSIERGDRRYMVISNFKAPPPEYLAMCRSCFTTGDAFSEDFIVEVEAFYYDMLRLDVDKTMLSRPQENEARQDLINSNLRGHEAFIKDMADWGFDTLMRMHFESFELIGVDDWDCGDKGVDVQMVYNVYKRYCRNMGYSALSVNKLGAALSAAGYAQQRLYRGKQRIRTYLVPRTPGDDAATGPQLAASVEVKQ